MADWTDGPEYAPADRPAAFVAPDAIALAEAPSAAVAATDFPADEPSFVAPTAPSPDLRELVPTAAPGRNPNLPLDRKSTRLNSSHRLTSRMPSSA
jgi:hypothetical protein